MSRAEQPLPPAIRALIEAMAEVAVEDYLTEQAAPALADAAPPAKPVPLPRVDRAA